MKAPPLTLETARRTLFLLAGLACSDTDAGPFTTRTYTDTGSLCLSPRGAGGSYIQILIEPCESACADVSGTCEATLIDGTIAVQSLGRASEEVGISCSEDCRPLEATCVLPELPDGNYELRFGSGSATVSMPVPVPGRSSFQGPTPTPTAILARPCRSCREGRA